MTAAVAEPIWRTITAWDGRVTDRNAAGVGSAPAARTCWGCSRPVAADHATDCFVLRNQLRRRVYLIALLDVLGRDPEQDFGAASLILEGRDILAANLPHLGREWRDFYREQRASIATERTARKAWWRSQPEHLELACAQEAAR